MKRKRRLSCLLLTILLLVPLGVQASAAEYTDLPESHWAYSDMTHAVRLGILTGMGGNQMMPEQIVTWDMYLAMVTRAFVPALYQSGVNAGLSWDQAGYQAALQAGLILPNDFLPVDGTALNTPITRQDVAVLLHRALPAEALNGFSFWAPSAEEELLDWNEIDPRYRQAVSDLFALRIIRGSTAGDDGLVFSGMDELKRCDGSVLLMRAVAELDDTRYGEDMLLTLTFVDAAGSVVADGVQVLSYVGQSSGYLAREYAPQGYTMDYARQDFYGVSGLQDHYTLNVRPLTLAERMEEEFWDKVDRGEASAEDYYTQDFWLLYEGENSAKSLLLFGDTGRLRFSSREEATANMTTITVPVWKLSNGKKVPSTASLTIHKALADNVTSIFTEIYNDPEQFPIYSTSTFRYVEGTSGEHNCGTAIDLNSTENYQVREGVIESGNLWKPGENPYSIPENGSVVRIFAEHGWSWGGNAWAGHSDPSYGYHDYMHFSYMGR